jgi:hypothetical protein
MTKIPHYEQRKIAYFEKLYNTIELHAQGQGRAKTKKNLWTTVVDMWDQTSDIPAPTPNWFDRHHSEFYDWCRAEGHLVLDCQEGLFIPNSPRETKDWVKDKQKPRQEGCARSNNGQQDLIAEKNPESSPGLFRTVLQGLLPPANR